MGRRKYKFKLKHDLEKFIRLKQAERVIETGEPITQNDIKKELVEYVGISDGTLISFLTGRASPSLIVGMAIAEYFGVKVEDIFSIERRDENDIENEGKETEKDDEDEDTEE